MNNNEVPIKDRIKGMQLMNPNLGVREICLLLGIDYDKYVAEQNSKSSDAGLDALKNIFSTFKK